MLKYQITQDGSYFNFTINHQLTDSYQNRVGVCSKSNAAHVLMERISKDPLVIRSNEESPNRSELIVIDGNQITIKTMCLDKKDSQATKERLLKKIQRFTKEQSRKLCNETN